MKLVNTEKEMLFEKLNGCHASERKDVITTFFIFLNSTYFSFFFSYQDHCMTRPSKHDKKNICFPAVEKNPSIQSPFKIEIAVI
mmetsp:Transcript_629/g.1008  ORF Transcript_629/g.1008 Transcript_629/m.1008 type:complete len:84 (+) Transcript_629:90-341(+)